MSDQVEVDYQSQDKPFRPLQTADGSWTFYSAQFREAFHSIQGAHQEARQKFVLPTQLGKRSQAGRVRILDVCYGLGYNTAAALGEIWAANPQCQVEWVGLELDERIIQVTLHLGLLTSWAEAELLQELAYHQRVTNHRFQGQLYLGDARQTLPSLLEAGFQTDVVFLDPFSPPRCPALWTVEFLGLLAQSLEPRGGQLVTYSCAAAVRTALGLAGLAFGPTPAVGRRAPGTLAAFDPALVAPLSDQEREHLQTRGAVPYRDPTLQDSADRIQARRLKEQQFHRGESTASWKRRWSQSGLPNPGRLGTRSTDYLD